MTRLLRSFSKNVLVVGALTIALAPQALRAQCSNATLKGTYVVSESGMVGTGPAFGPMAVVALVTFNGDGTGTVVAVTRTVAGQTTTSSNVPVTYTVNPDCTGSETAAGGTFNLVITPDGNTITLIAMSAGVTLQGTGIRRTTFN